MQLLEHDEEGGNNEEQGNSTDAHTADDTQSEGTVTVSTSTTLYHKGNHTDNHRRHRHQDGAQTFLTSFKGGLNDGHALGTALRSELGNQDSRLCQQTNQHDYTRLQVDVVVHARNTLCVA